MLHDKGEKVLNELKKEVFGAQEMLGENGKRLL